MEASFVLVVYQHIIVGRDSEIAPTREVKPAPIFTPHPIRR